ncbi:hypothetical protein LSH36_1487g00178 [Paralvinella palmiformis]|uniref:Uncharacterized protein n=1 Tax=Paralvinella palmiformis TaxID=53620 RepID=A0AAD9MR86_9ANNE|nr:hypothetical protein LSH36_1487g00178 [Paralvinella palmiformis]
MRITSVTFRNIPYKQRPKERIPSRYDPEVADTIVVNNGGNI